MNLGDVVGQLMRDGLSPQTKGRIKHAVGSDGLGAASNSPDLGALLGTMFGGQRQSSGGQSAGGGLGDVLGGLLGGSAGGGGGQGAGAQGGGGLGDILSGLGQMLGQDSGVAGMSKGQLGGLGALAGAILGGGGGATKGAIGGSAMALLGTLALSALKNWQAQSQGAAPAQAVSLTANEVRQIGSPETAELCLRGMIEAMKSDGEVSPDEVQRLIGKLSEGGITSDEQQFVQDQLSKPHDLDGLVRAIPNPEVGIQVYAAALMAISVDTPAERKFLQSLAAGAGLDRDAVARLHQLVGAPAA